MKKKTKKKKIGRPTKMTEARVKKLLKAYSIGCTDIEACIHAGISKQTLYNYEKKNKAFVDQKEDIKETLILIARRSLAKGIPKDPKLALKVLERRKPEEYAPIKKIDVRGEVAILTDAELARRLERVLKAINQPAIEADFEEIT